MNGDVTEAQTRERSPALTFTWTHDA